ncbi:MAG: hypothetical protein U1E70_00395 [Acetobacteraceae bacterium]
MLINAVALGLLGTTGIAVATPSLPDTISGFIEGAIPATLSFSDAFISTFVVSFSNGSSSPVFDSAVAVIGASMFAVYATVTQLLSNVGSSVSSLPQFVDLGQQLIGYVLEQDVLGALQLVSNVGSGVIGPFDKFTMYEFVGIAQAGPVLVPDGLEFRIPEPNGIAILVTAIAGISTLLRRRRLRRQGG